MSVSEAVRERLRRHGLHAKKSWGQNFLVDERTYAAIVDAAAPAPDDVVIEIGAGLGTLTERLAAAVPAGQVIAIERERDMAAVLRAELGGLPNVEIAEANALTWDYAGVMDRIGGAPIEAASPAPPRRPIVVGNLPYQIASPILFRLLDARARLARIVVMLQREMADRIVARPGTSEYGALGVMVQMLGSPRLVCRVPPGAFLPPPRVASAVLRIDLHDGTRVPVRRLDDFRAVVRAAFGQRRKTLRNALRALGDNAAVDRTLAQAAIDGQRRGETLDLAEFARLADAAEPAGLRLASAATNQDLPENNE